VATAAGHPRSRTPHAPFLRVLAAVLALVSTAALQSRADAPSDLTIEEQQIVPHREGQRQTMESLRRLAVAIQLYESENGGYPEIATDGWCQWPEGPQR
jgi:hypothetical protein